MGKSTNSTRSCTKGSTPATGAKTKSGSRTRQETSHGSSTPKAGGAIADFTAERFGDCIRVNVPCTRKRDWRFWCLVTFDRHWDNPHSDRQMQKRHLDQMIERGGCWFDGGDLFCAMQGKYDKRASKDSVRPEHQTGNYLDSLVNTAAEWFQPYASRCVFMQHGNHERSIKNRHETDLTERLIGMLNQGGANVLRGKFTNITLFRFQYQANPGAEAYRNGSSVVSVCSDHGYGGGGPVTQDMIQHQRRSAFIDTDVVVSGHTHDAWQCERMKLRYDQAGKVRTKSQLHLKVPTYKDDYGVGDGGWHVETGKPPKPLGAWWLKFFYDTDIDAVQFTAERAA
jgi:hypothetical protein